VEEEDDDDKEEAASSCNKTFIRIKVKPETEGFGVRSDTGDYTHLLPSNTYTYTGKCSPFCVGGGVLVL
jgi:hypothetical protein